MSDRKPERALKACCNIQRRERNILIIILHKLKSSTFLYVGPRVSQSPKAPYHLCSPLSIPTTLPDACWNPLTFLPPTALKNYLF